MLVKVKAPNHHHNLIQRNRHCYQLNYLSLYVYDDQPIFCRMLVYCSFHLLILYDGACQTSMKKVVKKCFFNMQQKRKSNIFQTSWQWWHNNGCFFEYGVNVIIVKLTEGFVSTRATKYRIDLFPEQARMYT